MSDTESNARFRAQSLTRRADTSRAKSTMRRCGCRTPPPSRPNPPYTAGRFAACRRRAGVHPPCAADLRSPRRTAPPFPANPLYPPACPVRRSADSRRTPPPRTAGSARFRRSGQSSSGFRNRRSPSPRFPAVDRSPDAPSPPAKRASASKAAAETAPVFA